MAYSQIGIINLALGKIGPAKISSLTETSAQAEAAVLVWEYVRNEVLEARDWRFAKERVALAQNATAPVSKYDYAYTLPADFLRIAKDSPDDPSVYSSGSYSSSYLSGQLEIQGKSYDYIIENISDDTLCLFTDYDNTDDDLYLTYIKAEASAAKYSAHFISALAFRLAAELSFKLTESSEKYDRMMKYYDQALIRATAHNQGLDHNEEEGSDAWETAGR
jgi:hypothetical protein